MAISLTTYIQISTFEAWLEKRLSSRNNLREMMMKLSKQSPINFCSAVALLHGKFLRRPHINLDFGL